MRRAAVWLSVGVLVACQPGGGAPPPVASPSAAPATRPPVASPSAAASAPPAEAPGFYLGRRIAPTMSHEAADWLTRPEREAEEHAGEMLRALGVRPGDVACDVGAGNGYHTMELARMAAPGGKAIAVDIQPEMLEKLRERARAAGVTNVETVLGEGADPRLPAHGCDLVLLADVYHELDDPSGMLRHLRAALSSRGVVALLEFRAEDPKVPIKPEHKMSRAQMDRELAASGFAAMRSVDTLPWQHLVFYAPRAR